MELFGEKSGNTQNNAALFSAGRQATARLALDALRESGELFRSIFNNATVGIALVDKNDFILEANQAYCSFLGYTRDELIGMHYSAFTHPEDLDLDANPREALLKGVIENCVLERRYLRKDGGTVWGRLNVSLIRDKRGKHRYKLVLLEDITSLKARESEIAALKRIYSAMLGALAEASLTPPSRDDGINHLANMALSLQEAGYEEVVADRVIKVACDFTSARCGVYFGYDESTRSLSLVSATGVTGDVKAALADHRFPLGEERGIAGLVAGTRKSLYLPDAYADPRWVATDPNARSCYFVPLYYREKLFGVFALVSDRVDGFTSEQRTLTDTLALYISAAMENARLFTEIRRVYEMLNVTREQLFHAQKMEAVGQLAGGVAHALNNQLTIIQACVDLQTSRLPKSNSLYRTLLKIRKAAWRSANLARQLMLFGRKHPQFRVVLDLNSNLEELREMLERLIGEDITIRFELSGDLRPIMADAANIEQVIINLVLNAWDAMPGGGTITIKTENVQIEEPCSPEENAPREREFVCLTVSDTGTGMDGEVMSRIFEPFFTTKEPGKGTGLGLSVAYGIVKAHDGWINVKSKVGSGTTFEVLLPALDPEAPAESIESSQPRPEVHLGTGERVLQR